MCKRSNETKERASLGRSSDAASARLALMTCRYVQGHCGQGQQQ